MTELRFVGGLNLDHLIQISQFRDMKGYGLNCYTIFKPDPITIYECEDGLAYKQIGSYLLLQRTLLEEAVLRDVYKNEKQIQNISNIYNDYVI